MNPLSAIRNLTLPEIKPLPLPKVLPRAADGAQPISFQDLEKISPQFNASLVAPSTAAQNSFGSTLGQLVQDVSAKSAAADASVNGLLAGQNVPLHQTVIAMEEAGVSFQLMVQVRNKLLESYQELMRMQV
jgi:flagellar hook-basal body complex protein FliE